MAHKEKSAAYRFLKENGVTFEKHYREYSTEELVAAAATLAEQKGIPVPADALPPAPELPTEKPDDGLISRLDSLSATMEKLVELQLAQMQQPAMATQAAPAYSQPQQAPFPSSIPPLPEEPSNPAPQVKPLLNELDPREHAGATANTHQDEDVIKVDEFGNQWYQIEVNKPAFPKRRGRRVLRTMDAGTVQETIKVGEYTETFEVSGDPKNAQPTEIKITLPSYQTGIYRAPNMPFRIHTYAGVRGFDMLDVQKYYGGSDLVPDTIKRMYVSTDLCYDIQSTIRTIENEYRERVLKTGSL